MVVQNDLSGCLQPVKMLGSRGLHSCVASLAAISSKV